LIRHGIEAATRHIAARGKGRCLVKVMAFYVVIVLVGAAICWGIGEVLEQYYSVASLPVFLVLFFLNFYVSWRIALRLTEPRRATVG
jgi:hypothetical protein